MNTDKTTKYCTNSTQRDVWLSLDEYTPYYFVDLFTDEWILVCNREDFSTEGYRVMRPYTSRGDSLDFESIYEEDNMIKATHFMLIGPPQN